MAGSPVLVVDDNPGFLRVMRSVFEHISPSFSVHTVETGTDALAFLEQRPPFGDAPRPVFVVLDYRLPDMNAPVVLEQLGRQETLKGIPVLVLSQAGWAEDAAAATAAGAKLFRVKPSRIQVLRDVVFNFWKEYAHAASNPVDRG